MATIPTTLANLIQMVRWRADLGDSSTGSEYVTDAEITAYLNSSLGELDDILTTTYETYKTTKVTISITSGNSFPVPANFLQLRGVDRQISGVWATLYPFNSEQRNSFNYPWLAAPLPGGYAEVFYQLAGANVEIIPASSAIGVYQLHYVPEFVKLVSVGDTLQSYMDSQAWHEFAVAGVCAKILMKQDLDPSAFFAEKQAHQQRIVNAAKPRDIGPPKSRAGAYRRGGYGRGY